MDKKIENELRRYRRRLIPMYKTENNIREVLGNYFEERLPLTRNNYEVTRALRRRLQRILKDMVQSVRTERRAEVEVEMRTYNWRPKKHKSKIVLGECFYEKNSLAKIVLSIPRDLLTRARHGDLRAHAKLHKELILTTTHELLHWKQYSRGFKTDLGFLVHGTNIKYLSDFYELVAWARDAAQELKYTFKNDFVAARKAIKDPTLYGYLARTSSSFASYHHSVYKSRSVDAMVVWDEYLRYISLYLKEYERCESKKLSSRSRKK